MDEEGLPKANSKAMGELANAFVCSLCGEHHPFRLMMERVSRTAA